MTKTTGKASLKDAMNDVNDNEVLETPVNEDNVDEGTPVNTEVAELEKTEVFQNLPQAVKDSIRSGNVVDDEISDIDAALKKNENLGLDYANKQRAEMNLPPITDEEFKQRPANIFNGGTAPDDDSKSLFDDFERQLADINKEDYQEPDDDPNPETADEKRLRIFEKQLEEGVLIDLNPRTGEELRTAPLNYSIKRNTAYEDIIKSTLTDNNISFKATKKGNIKSGLLRDFVNRHPNVTTPLLNSGYHVTMSGASIPEIIQMNTIKAKTGSEVEMKKLGFITKHIVDSSIGKKLTTTQLAKTVFYKDLQTLYFNLILGTLPEEFEYPTTCTNKNCKQELRLKIKASSLVLNADEFEDVSKYILYETSDIQDVLSYSKVSKEQVVVINSSKVAVTIINPTIYDSIFVASELEKIPDMTLSLYQDLIGYLLYIKNIGIPDGTGNHEPFNSLEEMLEILSSFSTAELAELDDAIKDYSLTNMVKYGISSFTCPKCGKVHPQTEFDLSTMLFIVSQLEAMRSRISTLKQKEKLKEQ